MGLNLVHVRPLSGRYQGMARPLLFTAALVLLALAALRSCGNPDRITEVMDPRLFEEARAEPRLDRAPRAIVDYMSVDPKLYGCDAGQTNSSFDADVCEVSGRRFLFVTRQPDDRRRTLHWLEMSRKQPAATIDDSIEPSPAWSKLSFDVDAVHGGVVLIHANGSHVVERRAKLTPQGLEFSPARTLSTGTKRVLAVQLTRTDDRLHALWTTDDDGAFTSYHCSSPLDGISWTAARELTAHGCWTGARMAAGKNDLYVAWCDSRWRWRKNWFSGYENDGKVCVIVSRDGGRSFTSPVVLNDPEDYGDVAHAVDLFVGRGGLAVSWRTPRQASTLGRDCTWGLAGVDFQLRHMHRGGGCIGGVDRCR